MDLCKGDGCAIIRMNNGENNLTPEFIASFHKMLDAVEM